MAHHNTCLLYTSYMSFRSFSSFFALRRRLRAGKEPRRSGWRCSARINAACLAGSFILVAPVSYTHLDVYKRQLLYRA